MKTGEALTDTQGTTWTVGQELGRGTYARSFVARSAEGREAVLTVALGADDLPGAPELVKACGEIIQEQARYMRERKSSYLPDLLDAFPVEDGRQALLMPRYGATLATRIRSGAPLSGLLEALIHAARALNTSVHGNLCAENLLLSEDGSVRLADPITPIWQAHDAALRARAPARTSTRPPESSAGSGPAKPTPMWDTYAVCLALYQAASLAPPGADGRREEPPPLPQGGLDKVALSAVKDRVHARLQTERANPRFASRVSDKLGAVLNRGLSRQPDPSPPYRFNQMNELHNRLVEVHNLIDPAVVSVGKVLLAASAKEGMFEGGEAASFSTTVTVTPGASHEDLATGLLVRDLDAEGDDRVPVPDARYAVKPHASGRLRFDFDLPELRPGRYTVRVAFTLKDSGHEPQTSDGHFEIRPPPGYVPPAEEPPPETNALRFPGGSGPDSVPELDEPVLDESPAPFPSPIAPSDPGMLQGLGDLADDDPPGLAPVPTPAVFSSRAPRTEPPRTDGPRLGIAPGTPVSPPPLVATPSATGPATGRATAAGPHTATAAASPSSTAVPLTDPGTTPSDSGAGQAPPPAVGSPGQPMSSPAWGPGQNSWENLPGLDDPVTGGGDSLLPTPEGMQDLPGFDDPNTSDSVGAVVDQIVTLIRENALIALAVVIGLIIVLLVLAGLVFQALAG